MLGGMEKAAKPPPFLSAGGDRTVAGEGSPSLPARLLVLLSLALWPLSALHQVANDDIWWHLTAGDWILEHGRVPTEEFASWTAAGTPWFDYEWLWQLGVLWLWRTGAGPALVLSTALLALAAGVLLYLALRETGAGIALASVLLWLALFAARLRFQARPEMVTYPLLALCLLLILRARRTGRWRALWVMVPLTALWANMHPGFLFALGLLGLAALGEMVEWVRARARPGGEEAAGRAGVLGVQLGLVTAACGIASLLSPRPLGPHLLVLESFTGFRAIGFRNVEWEPMPLSADALPFWFLLLGTLALLLLDFRRLHATDLLWLATFGLLAVQTQRSAALLALVAPPVAARSLLHLIPVPVPLLDRAAGEGRGKDAALACGALCLAAVGLLPAALHSPVAPPGWGVQWSRQPVEAASFIAREDLRGRIFNHYRLGGYLGYRFYPDRPVFADGKHIPYVPVLREMEAAMGEGYAAFQTFLAERGVEIAVLHYDQPPELVRYGPEGSTAGVGRRAWSAMWFHRQDWALVFWDDAAMVKVRRRGANMGLVPRAEYRRLDPEDWRWQLAQARAGRLETGAILAELERKLREDPDCRRALRLREAFGGAAAEAVRRGD